MNGNTMVHLRVLHLLALIGVAAVNADVNICENVVNNLFLPHVSNCSQYYLCMEEVAVPRTCPLGYYFDFASQECTDVMATQCIPSCQGRGLSSFGYPRTCDKYVLCFDNTPVVRKCSSGLQYNDQTDRCDYPQYVDCAENLCIRQNNPQAIVYASSKSRCDKYYICLNGRPIAQNCTSGLKFNNETDSCDFPSKVECDVETLQRNILPFARAPPRRATVECPAEGAHFIAHEKRQDAYYYCLNGRGITLDCTPGLVFDAQIGECRLP